LEINQSKIFYTKGTVASTLLRWFLDCWNICELQCQTAINCIVRNKLLFQTFSGMYDHLHHSVSDSSVLYYESDDELTSYVLLG